MAPRTTRSKAKGPIVKTEAEAIAATSSVTQKKPLQSESKSPPKLFILPKDASPAARIVTLAHPKTSEPTRCFVCPEKGFYEFTKITAPKSTPRSWLLTPSASSSEATSPANGTTKTPAEPESNEFISSKGYIASSASLFLATPLDPLFLLLPSLAGNRSTKSHETKRLFLEADDYFDALSSSSPHLKYLLRQGHLRSSLIARMAAVCDTVDAGDETMYRLSEDKLLAVLAHKCKAMVEKGLPASMEEELVRKALETPLLSVTRGEVSQDHELSNEGDTATPKSDTESQTAASAASSSAAEASEASTAVTTPEKEAPHAIEAPEGVAHLLRLRTALMFICASYIQPSTSALLFAKAVAPTPGSASSFPDFGPLDKHLKYLEKLRAEALAARSIGESFSRKREYDEDGESRAEKKRKKEEEEKLKKKNESRGVRELKKVNTTGMKKMSDFFKKKT
jgi:hypothetical protein